MMKAPEVRCFGQTLRPLEPVAVVASLLGLGRGAAFRAAEGWPCTGTAGARKVVLPRLLADLGIDFQVVSATDGCQMGDSEAEQAEASHVCAGQDAQERICPRDCGSVVRQQ